jgi:hypothetical protein
VYDALNVFSALNIISKERNKIRYNPEKFHLYPTSTFDPTFGCDEDLNLRSALTRPTKVEEVDFTT